MKAGETDEAKGTGAGASEADIVEMGGETTAAATGTAETGAAKGDADGDSAGNASPVGAGTMVKVSGETDSSEER
jgi:hypothetical protein